MKTLLPSGVSMYPVRASRSNVRVLPETVPGVHTMPVGGASAGIAAARAGTSRPPAATRISAAANLMVAPSDIGLAHDGLRGQGAGRGVHPDLGHHAARARHRGG